MGNIITINNKELESILKTVSRQYLVGNLQRPQELDFVRDTNLEVGITDYSEYATEPVHYHTEAVEYQYMISGWTQYMDVESGEIYEYYVKVKLLDVGLEKSSNKIKLMSF